MDFVLYNSLTRKKEIFVPQSPEDPVRIYVCGPTVYDFAHLGNARAMVVFDVLFRLLKAKYPSVEYTRNITDVDDKIYKASVEKNCSIADISAKFEAEFLADMEALNVLPPTHAPHATAFIPAMIAMIQTLIAKGFAYEEEGHVLFAVKRFSSYGSLAQKSLEELMAGARIEVASYKREAGDFVLWKPSAPEQPGWDSPWGRGRPGWHIECSAMSAHYYGGTFDIHAGGIDLIFPHHENERAQSCCALGVPEMARFWLHNGHLMVGGKKMSKSLGNFLTVRQLRTQHNPEALRLALLSAHYRQPLDWTEGVLSGAQQLLNRWYRVLAQVSPEARQAAMAQPWTLESNEAQEFAAALHDDMNTPLALQSLTRMIQLYVKEPTTSRLRAIYGCGQIMGLLYQEPEAWFKSGLEEGLSEDAIEEAIEARRQAKQAKDYAKADALRQQLLDQGIVLEDAPGKTTWRRL